MKKTLSILIMLGLILSLSAGMVMAQDPEPVDPVPVDAPPVDEPPADTPPADVPPADTPPADEPPADTPPADEPPADTPPADEPPVDEPPAVEEPVIEEPIEEPVFEPVEEPVVEEPVVEEPVVEEPVVEEPVVEEPVVDEPAEEPAVAASAGVIGQATYPAGESFTSRIYLQNTTGNALDYSLELYDVSTGNQVTCTGTDCSKTIQGNSGHEINMSNLTVGDGMYGAVVKSNEVAVAAVNTWSEKYGMGYSNRMPGSSVYFPNVNNKHANAEWVTFLYVQNADTQDYTDVYMDWYDLDTATKEKTTGPYSIKQGRTLEVDPTKQSLNTTYYAVKVYRQGGAAAQLVGVANQLSTVMVQAMSYSGFTGGATKLYLPNIQSYYGAKAEWFTPIVIQNMSNTDKATVKVSYYKFGASSATWTSGNLDIPKNAGIVERIWDRVSGTPLQDGVQYSVVVESTNAVPIAAVVNQTSKLQNQSGASTSVSQVADKIFVPYVVGFNGSNEWFTPVIFQNVGTGSTVVTVRYYVFDTTSAATSVASESFTLSKPGVANASRPYDLTYIKNNPGKLYVAQATATNGQDIVGIVNVSSNVKRSQDYFAQFEAVAP